MKIIICIFFFLSYSLTAQEEQDDFEMEILQIRGIHAWEKTMLKVLEHSLNQTITNSEYSFIKVFKIKTVRKYLTEIKPDSTIEKKFQYEINYDSLGNLTSEKTPYYISTHLYNDKGFLIDITYKKTDTEISRYHIGSVISFKEQKYWSSGTLWMPLKKHLFFNSNNEVSSYIKYSYLKNHLLSKIRHYGGNDKLYYFYSFEYEHYP
jgi:hypothetical protein